VATQIRNRGGPAVPLACHLSPITLLLRALPASGIIVPRDTPLTNVRKMTVVALRGPDRCGEGEMCGRQLDFGNGGKNQTEGIENRVRPYYSP
jgi:hypothetical protein